MRILFEMDKKDYIPNGSVFSRPSARAVIIKDGKIAMVYSRKYNYSVTIVIRYAITNLLTRYRPEKSIKYGIFIDYLDGLCYPYSIPN